MCFSELSRKGSEPPQFDSISTTQSFDHFVQYRVDDFLYVALKKVWVLRGNTLYEFRFYHERSLQIGAIFVKRPRIDPIDEISLQICTGVPQVGHDLCGNAFPLILQLTAVCLLKRHTGHFQLSVVCDDKRRVS